ncbi:MAG: hypothetical protein KY450_13835 [Actinobacteria bacterium]|nr:hypothetical protein [Actinomycetota bacterium]
MGWCHEFGPQIVEGCDHPMVAGASSCTCGQCGAVCAGRFAGCGDVFARGPRSVTVRVKPTEEPVRRGRAELIQVLAHQALPVETAAIEAATNGTGAGDTSTMVMLDHLWEKVHELETAAAARSVDPVSSNVRLDAVSTAVGSLAAGLDRLVSEVQGLQGLPARMAAVEAALERRTADADRLKKLTGEMAGLGKVGSRVTALEQAKRTSTDRDLATLASRVTDLEQASRPSADQVAGMAKAAEQVDQLSKRVTSVEEAVEGQSSVQSDRVAALESVLDGLVQGLERISTDVSALGDLPKRLEALEESKTPPTDKVLSSISKRLDRLSTQVSNYRDLPDRVEAAERGAARADALSRGLHRAIESIDHLSAQVNSVGQDPPTATAARPAALPPQSDGLSSPSLPPSPPADPPPRHDPPSSSEEPDGAEPAAEAPSLWAERQDTPRFRPDAAEPAEG